MILRFTSVTDDPPDTGDVWFDVEHVSSVFEGWVTKPDGSRILTARVALWNGSSFLVYDELRTVGDAIARAQGQYEVEIV